MTRDDMSGANSAKRRLLYVVTEDWAFLSHRLPMARAAREAGFEVHVATRVSDGAAAIEAERFILHPIPFARGSLSPAATLSTVAALRRHVQAARAAQAHHSRHTEGSNPAGSAPSADHPEQDGSPR